MTEKQPTTEKTTSRPTRRGHGNFGAPPEKARDFLGTLKKLVRYLRPYWSKLIIILILTILGTAFSIVGPKILGGATNQLSDDYFKIKVYDAVEAELLSQKPPIAIQQVADPRAYLSPEFVDAINAKENEKGLLTSLDFSQRPTYDFSAIAEIIVFLLSLYLFSAFFLYIQGWIMTDITQKIVYELRRNLSLKINRLPLGYFDKRPHGDVLSRVTNDVETISQTFNQSLSQMFSASVMVVGIVIMMLSISWLLTLVVVLVLPLSFFAIKFITKQSQVQFVKQQALLGQVNGHVEEMYGGHLVMKVFNGERGSVEKFNGINSQLYHSAWRSQFYSGLLYPLTFFIGNLGYVGVAVVGGFLAHNASLRIGDIQAFFQYVQQFNRPIAETANIANVLQSTVAAAERVFEFLEEEEEIKDKANIKIEPTGLGQVVFENVSFGYAADKPIIKNLSATIKAGSRVAIVGPTGAGKTTLVNLLMRFYEIDGGRITIDGVDIKELKRADLRKMFGMVLQDTWLFNGTIFDNIAYSRPEASRAEVEAVAREAQVEHFINSLPKNYDFMLDEETSNLSQGEKQLLTIARAMLAKTPMLILDEATSSVDTRTEVLIQKAMDNLMQGKTSFVIAHRLSTIRDADLILVMKDGDVIEQGTHQTLLAQKGFYAELYNSQFGVGEKAGV